MVTAFEEVLKSTSPPALVARAFIALRRVMKALQSGEVRAPADVVLRFARLYEKCMTIKPGNDSAWMEPIDRLAAGKRLDDPVEGTAIRLAASLFLGGEEGSLAAGEIESVCQEIRDELLAEAEGRNK